MAELISDTSPLQYLHQIGHLDILSSLASRVLVPPAVEEELGEGLGLGLVPLDAAERTSGQHARYLLAHLLEWHRREKNAGWWEYFRLRDLPEEEFFYQRAGLYRLDFIDRV